MKLLINVFLILTLTLAFFGGCQQQKPDPSQELKPIVDKYHEVWNGGNPDELNAIMNSDFVYHSNKAPDAKGIEGIKKVISSLRSAFPDVKLEIKDVLYSENKEASRWVLAGTNTGPGEMPPTGKSVKVWGESIIRFVNGKISEEWVAFDNQSFMEQLGFTMMPPSEEKH
jgi:steroid delta-isomerase-like uncharacterized protein